MKFTSSHGLGCFVAALAVLTIPSLSLAQSTSNDEIPEPGYIPGYRRQLNLGLSPYQPALGSPPGAVTPAYGAPTPREDWTFTWSGYMSATFQASIHERRNVNEGQSDTVLHIPPKTPDEWWSFTSTYPVQGSWVGMNFAYGTEYVTARVTLDTWNPSAPTTYNQLGSQYFINNAFLRIRIPTLAGIRLSVNAGFFNETFGNLGRNGGGMYANSIAGGTKGVGETLTAEYDFNDSLVGTLQHGILGPRVGKPPNDVAPVGANGSANPNWLAAYIHHLHFGLVKKGTLTLQGELHYLYNWSQDDRGQRVQDTPQTMSIDEAYIRDGHMAVYGMNARAIHPVLGHLGVGVAYIDAKYAYPLTGLVTYAGEGERVTKAFLGEDTGGTGKMLVAGANYSLSVGRLVTHPQPFPGDHADLNIEAAFHMVKSWTDYEPFDRTRHKYGVNSLYTFLPYMGVGLRVDRVVPNSLDSGETFHVITPRLQFKTSWNSHETITVHYVKWFYGPRTRSDNNLPPYQLDDQLVALNFNMWW